MNISLPPKELCEAVWPKFVDWLTVKLDEDAIGERVPEDEASGSVAMTFRHHEFAYCPFCGQAFQVFTPIRQRHRPGTP